MALFWHWWTRGPDIASLGLGALALLAISRHVVGSSLFSSSTVLIEALVALASGLSILAITRLRTASPSKLRIAFLLGLTWTQSIILALRGSEADLGLTAWLGPATAWVQKFSATWLLLLFWAAVAESAGGAPDEGEDRAKYWSLPLLLPVVPALAAGYSESIQLVAVASLFFFAFARLTPRVARKTLLATSLTLLFLAPWLPTFSWSLQSELLTPCYTAQPQNARGVEGPSRTTPCVLKARKVGKRLAIWRHASDLIRERPILGWGLGAGNTLPSHDLPMSAVLGLPDGLDTPDFHGIPGGHPHNAFLFLWLEFGLYGAICGAVILYGLLGEDRPESESRTRRAAVLTLQASFLGILLLNYPTRAGWIVLCVLVSGLLVTPTTPTRRARATEAFVLATLVFLGVTGLFLQKIAPWVDVLRFRLEPVTLAEGGNLVVARETRHRIQPPPAGKLEDAQLVDGTLQTQGWMLHPEERVELGLLFCEGQLLAIVHPQHPSPDLPRSPSDPLSHLFARYRSTVPWNEEICPSRTLQAIALTENGRYLMAGSRVVTHGG